MSMSRGNYCGAPPHEISLADDLLTNPSTGCPDLGGPAFRSQDASEFGA
jgi:hypothetical protein